MSADASKLLADPNPEITLDQLAVELNELAKIRDNARLAFCKRLALAYLMIVGHRPVVGASRDSAKFYEWVDRKIRAANGKQYTRSTIQTYVCVGFSKNSEKMQRQRDAVATVSVERNRLFSSAVRREMATDNPPKAIPVIELKKQGMPTDVAREVNALMTAWEQASSQARSQFMYIVTGKRIAA